ncbi:MULTISPECIES: hypothetical protein [Sphingobacterium]|uniref:hypothetical protein n=1 Tax=Sphingobacterium TaxID=28453 RepID=UPI00257B1280|nr:MULTISPECIES: hypothetical protein [Sphingobacterium]
MQYKIGDVVSPKFERYSEWPDRLIVGYDRDEYGNRGYLWIYPDINIVEAEVYTSLNHNDPEFNIFWKLKVNL